MDGKLGKTWTKCISCKAARKLETTVLSLTISKFGSVGVLQESWQNFIIDLNMYLA